MMMIDLSPTKACYVPKLLKQMYATLPTLLMKTVCMYSICMCQKKSINAAIESDISTPSPPPECSPSPWRSSADHGDARRTRRYRPCVRWALETGAADSPVS